MCTTARFLLVVLAASVVGTHGDPRQDDEKPVSQGHRLGSGHSRWRYYQNSRREAANSVNLPTKPAPRYICPNKGFIRLGNGCYHFSSMMATWQDAHFACNDLDPSSHLASLESAWEDRTIRGHLNRPETASLERWIGGIYDWKRGMWVWGRSGQPFTYHGFSRRSLSKPHWECTFMDPVRRYRWIHDSCLIKRHYICEAPLSRVHNHHNGDNGNNGFNGNNGHNGHNGHNGNNGYNGHNDNNGYNGHNGNNGHNGHNGNNSHNGHNGNNGHNGHNGHNGNNGHNDLNGHNGNNGINGNNGHNGNNNHHNHG